MKKKITKQLISQAREYALSGFSHRQICKSIGISHTTLYDTPSLLDTIRKAEDELRKRIADSILAKTEEGSESSIIFLNKRLNLFRTSYKMPQIKSVKSALAQISRINSDLASGSLPPELANSLIKNIELFLKAYEATEIEKRIEALEKR